MARFARMRRFHCTKPRSLPTSRRRGPPGVPDVADAGGAGALPDRTRGSASPGVSPNNTNPSLTWIRCHLLATHERVIRSAPGHVFLECQHCGARSRGWELSPARYAMPRRAAADAVSLIPGRPDAGNRRRRAGCAPRCRGSGWRAPRGPGLAGRAAPSSRSAGSSSRLRSAAGGGGRRPGARRTCPRPQARVTRPARRVAPSTASRAGRPHANHASFLPTYDIRSRQFLPSALDGAKVRVSVSS